MAEVYEVASFYAHFDIVRDGEERPPETTIRVCDSLSCALAGAREAADRAVASRRARSPRCARALHGRCDTAPVCEVGHRHVDHATAETRSRLCSIAATCIRSCPPIRTSTPTAPTAAIRVLKPAFPASGRSRRSSRLFPNAALRGLGGAGFPDRAQMAVRARRAEAAADGGQRRRGRARHLQGPLSIWSASRTGSWRAC